MSVFSILPAAKSSGLDPAFRELTTIVVRCQAESRMAATLRWNVRFDDQEWQG